MMAEFIEFESDVLGTQFVNPDQVRRVARFPTGDGRPHTIIFFAKDDSIVVSGELSETAKRLSQ